MAKVNGLQGAISGKLGNTVFRNRYGKTIAAQYQPNVENRRTDTQVTQREKFKLMNQVAALLAPGIGIPRVGSITGRNEFVRMNIALVEKINNENHVRLNAELIQLTKGSESLAYFEITHTAQRPWSNMSVDATGGMYSTGSGYLAVSTRPERRSLVLVAMGVPNNSDAAEKLLLGGVVVVEDGDPTAARGSYVGQVSFAGFENLDRDEYTPIVYGYEVITPSFEASRRYGQAGGDSESDTAIIVLGSIGKNAAASNIYSATSYKIVVDE